MLVMLGSASKRVNECECIRLRHSIDRWQIIIFVLDMNAVMTDRSCKYARLQN